MKNNKEFYNVLNAIKIVVAVEIEVIKVVEDDERLKLLLIKLSKKVEIKKLNEILK